MSKSGGDWSFLGFRDVQHKRIDTTGHVFDENHFCHVKAPRKIGCGRACRRFQLLCE